ncbi:MAG: M23 family metallopeptidase [Pseudomonadota bacterium]
MHSWLPAVVLQILLGTFAVAMAKDSSTPIRLADHMLPGGLVVGQATPGSSVRVGDRSLRVSHDGRFVFGVGRDATGTIEIRITSPDGSDILRTVTIKARDYHIQRIDGLATRKVQPNPDDQAKIEADWLSLNDAKATDTEHLAFTEQATWPVIGPISGVYGSQRILNGIPRSPHRGVDVAAPEGTPVNAMLSGVVTVADADMFYTGGTVMVDHGHGVQSLYAHLSAIDVDVGQQLSRGQKLGEIGTTGRSTGPHLHLSLYWFDTALDPALVLGPMPQHQPRLKPSGRTAKN